MHPLETVMSKALETDEATSIEAFGGAKSLLEAAADLGKSPLMPEFLKLAIASLAGVCEGARNDLEEFACRCVENACDDFVLVEVVDIVDAADSLPRELPRRTFERFIGLAFDQAVRATTRSAALDGALRAAMMDRQRQLRLLGALLGVSSADAPQFLARTAKIMGIAYSHWKENDLLNRLRELSEISDAGPDACFELGMANLLRAIEAADCRDAETKFEAARFWLQKSLALRPHCPIADVYLLCIQSLLAFFRREEQISLANVVPALSQLTFQIRAWHSSESDPPWLGGKHAEIACWDLLAITMAKLANSLQEASWWEPAVVIEQHLLAAYVASRSILRRTQSGGVESMLRPRIEESLFREAGQAYSLRAWLARNSQHEWATEARQLSDRLSEAIRDQKQHRTEPGIASVAELLDQAAIPQAAKTLAKQAIADLLSVHFGNLSDAELQILEACLSGASSHPDYRNNPSGSRLFNAVVLLTVRFLNNRLDMTQGDDPGVAYLFHRPDGTLPHESELQADYFRFLFALLAGTEIEIANVGGGRADVRCVFGGERLVVEVKREQSDCSFEALQRLYSSQAVDYQNVSVRLGFLLVLDQTKVRTEGTPHLSTLVKASTVVRAGETVPRYLVTIILPGRRLRPSDLSKIASKKKIAKQN